MGGPWRIGRKLGDSFQQMLVELVALAESGDSGEDQPWQDLRMLRSIGVRLAIITLGVNSSCLTFRATSIEM